jgi:hypothetical protein
VLYFIVEHIFTLVNSMKGLCVAIILTTLFSRSAGTVEAQSSELPRDTVVAICGTHGTALALQGTETQAQIEHVTSDDEILIEDYLAPEAWGVPNLPHKTQSLVDDTTSDGEILTTDYHTSTTWGVPNLLNEGRKSETAAPGTGTLEGTASYTGSREPVLECQLPEQLKTTRPAESSHSVESFRRRSRVLAIAGIGAANRIGPPCVSFGKW